MATVHLGDARELVHYLDPGSVNCVICDPPYGVNFRSRRAETADGKNYVADIEHDNDLETARLLFLDVMIPLVVERSAHECEVYVFTRWDVVGDWIEILRELEPHGLRYKMLLVWDKGIPGMGDIDANWGCGHELILYAKKGKRDVRYRRSGILHHDKLGSKQHVHPTEKPVGLMRDLIEMSTEKGDLVVDPFAGSGSSLVAAEHLGRQAIGFELEQRYYDIIERRLSQQVLIP